MQPGLGPQRTIFAATPQGHQAAEDWLDTPVAHVRDIRSHLLLSSPSCRLTLSLLLCQPACVLSHCDYHS